MNQVTASPSKQRRRAFLYAIALACLVGGAWLLERSARRESPERHAQRLQQEHGVVISFGDPASFFTPPYDQAIPSSRAYRPSPAERDAVAVALPAIEESLRQYPSGFVSKLIRAIFLCGELQMDGAEAGGTVGPLWIILAVPRKLGVEGVQLTSRIGVHHELSSIVYHRQASTAAEWERFAPAGWKFTSTADAALKRFGDAAPPLSTGFLSAYGATTPENDFNVYAEKMFTEPDWVARQASKHELVRRKLDVVLAAYEAVDLRMKGVFRELRLSL